MQIRIDEAQRAMPEEINACGKREADKERIRQLNDEIGAFQKKEAEAQATANSLSQQISDIQSTLQQPKPFEETQAYSKLTEEINAMKQRETNASPSTDDVIDTINKEIQGIGEQVKSLQMQLSQLSQSETQKQRIEELKLSEKQLSKQFEELEKGIYLCDLFTKAKVDMLTERINSKFATVRFRLFVEQQNGGIKDDCEVMIPSEDGRMVPYSFANNAARINAGLEIISVLSGHWNLEMPLCIDNAEGITQLIKFPSQVIRLIVSKYDKALRLVLEEEADQEAAHVSAEKLMQIGLTKEQAEYIASLKELDAAV